MNLVSSVHSFIKEDTQTKMAARLVLFGVLVGRGESNDK